MIHIPLDIFSSCTDYPRDEIKRDLETRNKRDLERE